jgi:hypothetical protein
MGIPVKEPYVQFFFQFLDHQAKSGLIYAASLGRFPEVPIIVDGDDIAQLLKSHDLSVN